MNKNINKITERMQRTLSNILCMICRGPCTRVVVERCWEIKVVHIITAKHDLKVELKLLLNPVGIRWKANYILFSCRALPAATITLLSEMTKKTVENDQSE